jgi:hypothetical protein
VKAVADANKRQKTVATFIVWGDGVMMVVAVCKMPGYVKRREGCCLMMLCVLCGQRCLNLLGLGIGTTVLGQSFLVFLLMLEFWKRSSVRC